MPTWISIPRENILISKNEVKAYLERKNLGKVVTNRTALTEENNLIHRRKLLPKRTEVHRKLKRDCKYVNKSKRVGLYKAMIIMYFMGLKYI